MNNSPYDSSADQTRGRSAPPSARPSAAEDEFQQLPQGAISGESAEVRASAAPMGWVGLIFFGACSFFSWHSPTGGPRLGIIFLIFAVMSLYFIVGGATLRADENGMESRTLFSRHVIAWDEVQHARLNVRRDTFALEGENKKLAFAGPRSWRGDRERFYAFLMVQITRHGIALDAKAASPDTGFSRNTRVR